MLFGKSRGHEYRLVEMNLSFPAPGWLAICGVNFNGDGSIHSWSGEPVPLYAEGVKGVRALLKEQKVAFRRPILKESELPRDEQ